MSNRKVFCVIEQSGYKNTKYVEQHKKQFNNEYSDFYRLNFRYKDDPDAYLYKECSWIDGKNTVYNNVPKIYDYYIFIDDDIEFYEENTKNIDYNVAEKISKLLQLYKPLYGTFLVDRVWSYKTDVVKALINSNSNLVTQICGNDECCCIMSESFASVLLPIKQTCSEWFRLFQFISYNLFPEKSMMFHSIKCCNTESLDINTYDDNSSEVIYDLCRDEYKEKWKLLHKRNIQTHNKNIIKNNINKDPINFTFDILNKILDVSKYKLLKGVV